MRTDMRAAFALGKRYAKRGFGVPATLLESNTTEETKFALFSAGREVSPYWSASVTRLSWKRALVSLPAFTASACASASLKPRASAAPSHRPFRLLRLRF